MKNFVHCLVIALFACGSGAQLTPDASDRIPADAARHPSPDATITADAVATPDAPPPLPQGCNHMGNLPASRTHTYIDGDPIDPAILNELQDRDILSSGLTKIFISAAGFCDAGPGSGAGTAVFDTPSGAQWTIAGIRSVEAPLILPVGTVIHNIALRVKQTSASTASGRITEGLFDTTNTIAINNVVLSGTVATTGVWALTPTISDPLFTLADARVYQIVVGSLSGTTNFNGVSLTISGP